MKNKTHTILFKFDDGAGHPDRMTHAVMMAHGLETTGKTGAVWKTTHLVVVFEPDKGTAHDAEMGSAKILEAEILYDGLTPWKKRNLGMVATGNEDKPYKGTIRVIMRFTFDREVESKAALHSLKRTRYQVYPGPMAGKDTKPLLLGDSSSASSVLSESSAKTFEKELLEHKLLDLVEGSTNVDAPRFTFENGMPNGGHFIRFPYWSLGLRKMTKAAEKSKKIKEMQAELEKKQKLLAELRAKKAKGAEKEEEDAMEETQTNNAGPTLYVEVYAQNYKTSEGPEDGWEVRFYFAESPSELAAKDTNGDFEESWCLDDMFGDLDERDDLEWWDPSAAGPPVTWYVADSVGMDDVGCAELFDEVIQGTRFVPNALKDAILACDACFRELEGKPSDW